MASDEKHCSDGKIEQSSPAPVKDVNDDIFQIAQASFSAMMEGACQKLGCVMKRWIVLKLRMKNSVMGHNLVYAIDYNIPE